MLKKYNTEMSCLALANYLDEIMSIFTKRTVIVGTLAILKSIAIALYRYIIGQPSRTKSRLAIALLTIAIALNTSCSGTIFHLLVAVAVGWTIATCYYSCGVFDAIARSSHVPVPASTTKSTWLCAIGGLLASALGVYVAPSSYHIFFMSAFAYNFLALLASACIHLPRLSMTAIYKMLRNF
ncbi:MAG: hypothetical protein N4J56_007293 [Chroococcidiopsis sp. SAG 2025]|nr:hypothetical protein [Chroococcidiopsis sp. SAG 2025]